MIHERLVGDVGLDGIDVRSSGIHVPSMALMMKAQYPRLAASCRLKLCQSDLWKVLVRERKMEVVTSVIIG